jgi:hypothetical protein
MWRMSRGKGDGPPVSSAGARRKLPTDAKPARGRTGRVEAEWKQQREKPVAGMPQALVRLRQQSARGTAPATTGQRMPSPTRARKSNAERRRDMSIFIAQRQG